MSDEARTPLFRFPVSPRWRDLDAFNHVNNSNFLTYLEEARIRMFASLGKPWFDAGTAPLLAAVQLNYRAPITYPSEIVVELYADRIGTTSVTVGHRIVDAGDGTLYAGIRDYAETGLARRFTLAPGAVIEVSGRVHRTERDYEYSYRVVSISSLRWKLH